MALWTLADQQRIKPLDKNNTGVFEQLQREVEATDVVRYVGSYFYQELRRNPTAYATLMAGGTYTASDGYEYAFDGLKYVLCYLLYARYIRSSFAKDTPSGFVTHTGEGFQRISSAEIKNMVNQCLADAGQLWDDCKGYLTMQNLIYFPQKTYNKIGWL